MSVPLGYAGSVCTCVRVCSFVWSRVYTAVVVLSVKLRIRTNTARRKTDSSENLADWL